MNDQYKHVFRYGTKLSNDKQRWAFRFAILDPEPRVGRGRARALAVAYCCGLKDAKGEVQPFWSAQDAAVVCDAWKCYLQRYKGWGGVEWSLGTYDNAALAYSSAFGHSIEDYQPTEELNLFIRENDEAFAVLERGIQSNAWDPDVVMHAAEKALARERSSYNLAVRQWAVEYKDHCKLVQSFESFGADKFDIEISRYISLVERLMKCAPWRLPDNVHFRLATQLDKYRARRKSFAKLLEELRNEQTELRAFAAGLPLRTAELKQERVKISLSCNPSGATPTGSENGAVSPDAITTDKSSPTLPKDNKTS